MNLSGILIFLICYPSHGMFHCFNDFLILCISGDTAVDATSARRHVRRDVGRSRGHYYM